LTATGIYEVVDYLSRDFLKFSREFRLAFEKSECPENLAGENLSGENEHSRVQ
jgi:hypothetical protein